MSAHVYTALQQVKDEIDNNKVNFRSLQSALDFSTWTESLEIDQYRELQRIVTLQSVDALATFVTILLPAYREQWYKLSCPDTREQWINQEYQLICSV